MEAHLVLWNGEVVPSPGEPERAEGIAIIGEKIVAVGPGEAIRSWIGPQTEVVDLQRKVVLPGFNDAHIHLVQHGLNMLRWIDLAECRSIEEIVERLRLRAQEVPEGQWLLGQGFDQERLKEGRFPTAGDLDAASSRHPIFLTRLCLHAGVINSRARDLLDRQSLKDVDRGQFDWEKGLFTEHSLGPVWAALPEPDREEMVAAVERASQAAIEVGVTSVQCLIASSQEVRAFLEARRRGSLSTRVTLQYPLGLHRELAAGGLGTGFGDDILKIGAIKIFADGSLGARTAALSAPYHDAPHARGMLFFSDESLYKTAKAIHDSGFQIAIHAIGDAAVAQVVAVYETILGKGPDANERHRHRIEHASILRRDLLERMAQLRIVAAVQPQFVITDFWTIERVGPERIRYAYPFRSMLRKDIPLAFSSDCPVERLDPFETLARAMLRDEHTPQERLSLEEGLRAYTVGAAYADFEENRKGFLRPGMLADLIILPQGFLRWDASQVGAARPEAVLWGGRWAKRG